MSHRLRAVLGAVVLVTLAVAAGCGTPGPSATEIEGEETPTTDGVGPETPTTADNEAGAEPVNPGVGTTSAGTGSPTDEGSGGDGAATDGSDGQATTTTDGSDGETTESGGA